MSSWKANCSRWSVTISRVAVIGSPVVGSGRRSSVAGGPVAASCLIPSQIIGINGRSVNDARAGSMRRELRVCDDRARWISSSSSMSRSTHSRSPASRSSSPAASISLRRLRARPVARRSAGRLHGAAPQPGPDDPARARGPDHRRHHPDGRHRPDARERRDARADRPRPDVPELLARHRDGRRGAVATTGLGGLAEP